MAAGLALAAGPFVLGCGASASAGGAKAMDSTPLSDVASATAELDRAEGELTSLFGAGEADAAASASPAVVQAPIATQTAEPASPPSPGSEAVRASGDHQEGPATDACGIACRALASMERAASHLCGLSGETDATCSNARDRVKRAGSRVAARCTCS